MNGFVMNVKVRKLYLWLFVGVDDFFWIEECNSSSTTKVNFASFTLEVCSSCEFVSLQTVTCIEVDKSFAGYMQSGQAIAGTYPKVVVIVSFDSINGIAWQTIFCCIGCDFLCLWGKSFKAGIGTYPNVSILVFMHSKTYFSTHELVGAVCGYKVLCL